MGLLKKYKLVIPFLLIAGIATLLAFLVRNNNVAILSPKGTIANQQKDLLVAASLLSLIVVIPVFILTAFIAWKYRESNKNAKYTPDWDHNTILESIWWGIPIILILIIGTMTFKSSHKLDPFKALDSSVAPVSIQVVALQWKWLFIYPDYDIATVNFIQFPIDTPINFTITADAPMNSFWIPNLGGQIYAMSGMTTKLHLMANEIGDFKGSSANLSGAGFSDMNFIARSSSKTDFDSWLTEVQQSKDVLSKKEYLSLSTPSKNNPTILYSTKPVNLYNEIIAKYAMTMHQNESDNHQPHNHTTEYGN